MRSNRSLCRMSVILIALLLVFSAIAAGQGEGNKIILTFSHWVEHDDRVATIEAFNESQDRIEVRLELMPGAYEEALTVRLAAGEGPDLFSVQYWPGAPMPAESWTQHGWLMDLSSYMARSTSIFESESIVPFTMDVVTVDGKVGALPFGFSIFGTYGYNSDMFNDRGLPHPDGSWTWDDIVQISQVLYREDGDGNPIEYGLTTGSVQWRVVEDLIRGGGGAILNEDQTSLAINSPEAMRVLSRLVDSFQRNAVQVQDDIWGAWWQGTIGLKEGAIHHFTIENAYDGLIDGRFRMGMVPSPRDPFTGGRSAGVEVAAIGVNGNTDHPDAAWEVLEWFWENHAVETINRQGYLQYPPVRQQDMDIFLGSDPAIIGDLVSSSLPLLLEVLPDAAFVPPVTTNSNLMENRNQITNILSQAYWAMMNNQLSVSGFVDDVTRRVNVLLTDGE